MLQRCCGDEVGWWFEGKRAADEENNTKHFNFVRQKNSLTNLCVDRWEEVTTLGA